ncbi:MAG: N-acetyl-gamma-glutamyl-phosphate reductase [Chloroflexi bacterium]|nr:N-acetyl-gamma-glutamyl-phosphate reductase [Chloroflexota bacterium]MCH8102648.1 N-acetyl-gamma-glutamyl-phosphate reductase [Chloroflexota bacterium]
MANAAPKVFIDGSYGTTGLRIREWLADRDDIEVLSLAEEDRRDVAARKALLAEADLAVLCLPDDAAIEAAAWADESGTKVIDPSTAHRVADNWTYGLPEMDPSQREAIREETHVSNPGCYAIAVILGLRPLVEAGLLPEDSPITVHALSGTSGGGKGMIARWEEPGSELNDLPFESPYALERQHKHIPEMTRYSGLSHEPQFVPSVGPFVTGMRVEIPLHRAILSGAATAESISDLLAARYADEKFVRVNSIDDSLAYADPAFDPRAANGTNRIDLSVLPNELGHVLLIAQLDNLGKGASGSAIQNMNLMLGLPEDAGLPD